ncbi:MAG: TatD family hydrolase [Oscillospiraceae bacterium]|nr:TatD family hydrolase [Oscillospiraceae bacterium]
MYFDTHAHYTDEDFDADRDETINAVFASGVELIVNASSDYASCVGSVEIAEKYSFIYAAVGWHPHEAKTFSKDSEKLIREYCRLPKVRAIGEIGLDYYYDLSERDIQRTVFLRQMELASELKMPVVIHDRDAHADCMEIIRKFPDVKGDFHCYSGSAEMARDILDMGWYLGFTGAITFKNARRALEVIGMCPNDRILIETDCPYLAPVPNRGKRNDSRNLPYIAQTIADIKKMSIEEAAEITNRNGRRFFGIGQN